MYYTSTKKTFMYIDEKWSSALFLILKSFFKGLFMKGLIKFLLLLQNLREQSKTLGATPKPWEQFQNPEI